MAEKTLKTRIIQKHDTEANWLLATNFTPMNGEIIIYDEDDNYDYKRIKVGNGTDNINDLKFNVGSWDDLEDKPFGETLGDKLITIVVPKSYAHGEYYNSDAATIEEAYIVRRDNPHAVLSINGKNYSIEPGEFIENYNYNGFLVLQCHEEYGIRLYPEVLGLDSTVESYEFTLYKPGEFKQIDEHFIPDTIARVSDIPEVAQSDWLVNDESNPAFIKNKPFYTTDPTEVTIIPEMSVTFYPDEMSDTSWVDFLLPYGEGTPIIIGQTYSVNWNGTIYECVGTPEGIPAPNGEVPVFIGNPYISNMENENNNIPFLIYYFDKTNGCGILKPENDTTVTVSVTTIMSIDIKIDEKYLPDSVGKSTEGTIYNIDGEEVIANYGAEIFNDYENNIASGYYSHAEGSNTIASGAGSHAEGLETIATKEASHAEGRQTTASGNQSHAEGIWTIASEQGSHAEGSETTASGINSHAEGRQTTASGINSHAEGYRTMASGEHQHVQGKYNIEDTANKYAHIVGNGNVNDVRSNAHTLDWDGNAWYQGNVYVGGTKQDEGSKLATELYVDTALDGKANASHSHDDLYYTETEVDTLISNLNSQIKDSQEIVPIIELTNCEGVTISDSDDGNWHYINLTRDFTPTNKIYKLSKNTTFFYISNTTNKVVPVFNLQPSLGETEYVKFQNLYLVDFGNTIMVTLVVESCVLNINFDDNGDYVDYKSNMPVNTSSVIEDANALSKSSSYTPSADTDLSTKKYVDNSISALSNTYYTETEIDTKLSAIDDSIANITSGTVVVKEAEHADSADEAAHATSADSATKATQDASGNVITETYQTITDKTLETTDKTVVGAINELNDKVFAIPPYEMIQSGTTCLADIDITQLEENILYYIPKNIFNEDATVFMYRLNYIADDNTKKRVFGGYKLPNIFYVTYKSDSLIVLQFDNNHVEKYVDFTNHATSSDIIVTDRIITDGWLSINNSIEYTPTRNYNPATKKYVDDSVANIDLSTYETTANAQSKLDEAKSYADTIKNNLLNGAGEAYDTLKELGDLITENVDAIDALETVAASKADKEHTHSFNNLEDRPFYYEESFSEIIPETTISGITNIGSLNLIQNNTYTVIFNDVEYECVFNGNYLGNQRGYYLDDYSNGEPFYITSNGDVFAGSYPFTIKIVGVSTNLKLLDDMFISDNIQRKSFIVRVYDNIASHSMSEIFNIYRTKNNLIYLIEDDTNIYYFYGINNSLAYFTSINRGGYALEISIDDDKNVIKRISDFSPYSVNDDYYKKYEINNLLQNKADASHSHTISDITDLQDALDEIGAIANESDHFIVNITKNDDDTYSSDAYYDDIVNAFNEGKIITALCSGTEYPFKFYVDGYAAYFQGEVYGVNGWVTSVQIEVTNNSVNFTQTKISLQTKSDNTLSTTNKTIVGAINEVNAKVDSHNHDDLYYTQAQVDTKLEGKANATHTHDQYLTEHQDISGKADKSELFSKSYNDLTNKPEIPSIKGLATETYVNNGLANKVDKIEGKSLINIGEIARLSKVDNYDDTEVRDLIDGLSESKANVANIPTKVSQLTNDSGFLTAVPATYATQAFVVDAINKAQLDGSDSEIDLTPYALVSDLELKADKTELHTHENKMLLNTITAENISAINELTSTLNGPRNYYNAEAITDGVYLNSNGRLYENPIYFTTDYIPIAPGQTLYFYGANGRYDIQSNARFVGFFDTGRNFIEGSVVSLVNQITNTYENGAYIRITVQYGGWGLGYVENVYPGVDIKYGEIPESGLWEKPQKIDVFLPDDIYCAVGTTIELYNNQVCLQADKLHINWSCEYGHAMKRKFSFEGTSTLAGQIIPLTLEIYNDYNVLKYTQTTQIHVVAATITNPITCVPIGDSWTNQKPWPGEVINLSGEKISFVGKFNTTVKDANGNWREYNHEGRSGFSAYNYDGAFAYTFGNAGEDTYHAFYNPTTARFDWNNYVNTVLGGTQPGAVILQMGINGIAADNTGMVGHEVNMINLIRQDNTDIPIFVTLPAYKGNQDGLGVQESSDGHAYHRGVYDYLEKQKVMNYCSLLYEACKDMVGVYFIPLNICFDSEYNYGAQEVPVNPRATSIIEKIPMEAVHPQDYGYYQMADIVYSVMCGNLS